MTIGCFFETSFLIWSLCQLLDLLVKLLELNLAQIWAFPVDVDAQLTPPLSSANNLLHLVFVAWCLFAGRSPTSAGTQINKREAMKKL